MSTLYRKFLKNQVPHPPRELVEGLRLGGYAGPETSACSKFHISQQQTKEDLHGRLFFDSSPRYSPVAATVRGGSPSSHSGEIYKIDLWRTSARVHRENRSPKYSEKEINLGESGVGPNGLIDFQFRQYAEKHGLVVPSWDDIPRIYRGSTRGRIDSFSPKSRARLKFVASNCFPHLISQFCLSYPDSAVPKDGKTAKKQLEKFLRAVKRKFSGSVYLWVLEFQTLRGAPHFHVFFSFPRSDSIQEWLALKWADIVNPPDIKDALKMYRVHVHPRNFTKWDMKKGGYLSNKYLTKESQKQVPAAFESVGRFWGNSRNLVPDPITYFPEKPFKEVTHVDPLTGETSTTNSAKNIYRIMRRHHEASIRNAIGKKRKSRITNKALCTINLPCGGMVIEQYFAWLLREETKHIQIHEVPF